MVCISRAWVLAISTVLLTASLTGDHGSDTTASQRAHLTIDGETGTDGIGISGEDFHSRSAAAHAGADSESAIEVACAAAPKDAGSLMKCADAYHRVKQYDREIEQLDQAVPLASEADRVEIYFLRAIAYVDKHEVHPAIRDLDRALVLCPKKAIIFVARGNIRLFMKNYDLAIADFGAAIALERDSLAFYGRGRAYALKNDYVGALGDLNESLAIKPDDADVLTYRGAVRVHFGQLALAMNDLNEALKLKPDNAVALIVRGNAYTNEGEFKRAIEDYTNAFGLQPKRIEARRQRAWPELALGRLDDALADFEAMLVATPKSARSLYGRSLVERRRGDVDAAERDLAAAHSINPNIEATVAREENFK